ncbi:hypothetical protein TREMEDRAFT_65979 [Tremella mesenterica DSM 1558]|uniref:uncharacterized protein n=1 Tax=Tremella mesenterica (strain ATCC 24925 / CBS 8224 / DSM 1558 / NBRC 9311 / NRRL Y-6157 / RJB 2259-6 / UBC 559-6) TaxID=578456 RepID=UPI00032CC10B|nr:uncharacterized protein TREMEDRAFT_65979 [Tremella mesenterica DSM 1558]EIW65894.1 hypothetical protein TREMEDRAFT_65979 [Tremella mesenterica DSM 1558]
MTFITIYLLFLPIRAATTDPVSVLACSDYSEVLGYCHGMFDPQPNLANYTYANEFLSCMCSGNKSTPSDGKEAYLKNVGICESSSTTPSVIVSDLSLLLQGCATQEQNGSAAVATIYHPQGYSTSLSTEYGLPDQLNGALRYIPSFRGISWLSCSSFILTIFLGVGVGVLI